jgi:hypothetical protein
MTFGSEVARDHYATLASVPLMLQYESVLMRPEHLAAAGISGAD